MNPHFVCITNQSILFGDSWGNVGRQCPYTNTTGTPPCGYVSIDDQIYSSYSPYSLPFYDSRVPYLGQTVTARVFQASVCQDVVLLVAMIRSSAYVTPSLTNGFQLWYTFVPFSLSYDTQVSLITSSPPFSNRMYDIPYTVDTFRVDVNGVTPLGGTLSLPVINVSSSLSDPWWHIRPSRWTRWLSPSHGQDTTITPLVYFFVFVFVFLFFVTIILILI